MFDRMVHSALDILRYVDFRPLVINSHGPGRRNWRKASGSIATGNRWTGKPHEHKREIARRARVTPRVARAM